MGENQVGGGVTMLQRDCAKARGSRRQEQQGGQTP